MNERGSSLPFAMYVLVILMFGLWGITSLLIQEKHTFYDYERYVKSMYKADAVQEAFIYKLEETLENSVWTIVNIQSGTERILDSQDASDIRNFLVSDASYKAAVGLSYVDVQPVFPEWLDESCTSPLGVLSDLSPQSLCAKLGFAVDGISRTTYVKVQDIVFRTEDDSVYVENFSGPDIVRIE